MSRVVVLAGGSPHAHEFGAIGSALVELVDGVGHVTELCDHPDAAAAAVADADALVMNGLWWRMEGAAYDEWRSEHGYSPPESTRAALTDFVSSGGGLLAMHTAPICFDDWPEWGRVVGGGWRWGSSSHPPCGPVTVRVVAGHPVVNGVPSEIEVVDEVYGDLDLVDDIEVLATARRHDGDADQPVVWTHSYGEGRVVFDCFGHDVASVRHVHNALLIKQGLDWVLGAA